ncbi:MAG: hypothetical protein AAF726_10825 [Planctomycetota bacterium]
MLLNLVRLRYSDTPEFLSISAISSQMNYRVIAGIGGDFGNVEESDSAFLAPNVSGSISESPTVTFVPKHDQAFVRQLISPIPLDSVFLLSYYGWGIDRILRLFARDLNGLDNSLRHASAMAGVNDGLAEFAAIARAMGVAERQRELGFAIVPREQPVSPALSSALLTPAAAIAAAQAGYRIGGTEDDPKLMERTSSLIFWVSEEFQQSAEFGVLAQKLSLPLDRRRFEVAPSSGIPAPSEGRLLIEPRSPAAVLSYLARAVDVPRAHSDQFNIAIDRSRRELLGDLLNVRVSEKPQEAAWLQVPYRGHYFYIESGDVASRQTLSLAGAFLRLTLKSDDGSFVPVVTLPVGL